MRLNDITPLILTFNEEDNIGRALERLTWASRVIVVDSFSSDATLEIAGRYPQVEIYQRPFDDFAAQCNYGLSLVDTEWVLSLDADFICTSELIDEIASLPENPEESGYAIPYKYCIYGKPLRGSLLAPRVMLYRHRHARYEQDGHGHRVKVEGMIGSLSSFVHHDDRKPLSAFRRAQGKYVEREAEKLLTTPREQLCAADRIRLLRFAAPVLVPLYCLIIKGGILDGRAGWVYAFQRMYHEVLLSLTLYEQELAGEASPAGVNSRSAASVADSEAIMPRP